MGNATPLVSIITPAYNRATLLRETVESVLGQDYENIEHIVLDDGSVDETSLVLKAYEGRITWASQSNMGQTKTVNRGLEMSRGEFIAVVNSDDPVLPGWVQEMVAFMTARPDILVGYPDWMGIDGNSRPICTQRTFDYDYIRMLKWHHCIPGPGAFIRRTALALEPFWDPTFRYLGDFDYWVRLGLHGPFARLPKPLATFRIHQGSASVSERGDGMAAEHMVMMERFYSRPDLPPEIIRIRHEAMSSAAFVAGHLISATSVRRARKYYLRSFSLAPRSFLYPHRMLWAGLMLASILPQGAYDHLRRLGRIAVRLSGGRGMATGSATSRPKSSHL